MAKDTNRRYIWLLRTLLESGGLSYNQIRNRWLNSGENYEGKDLPIRTFHQHKNAVQEMFDINITSDPADGYRYKVEGADRVSRDNLTQWLKESAGITTALEECRDIRDRILLEPIAGGAGFLPVIVNAIRKNKVLEIYYQSFYMDEPRNMIMHPYAMKHLRRRWYMLGLDTGDSEVKQLALDRMKSVNPNGETFVYPKDMDPIEYYRNSIGVDMREADKPEIIVLRVLGKMIRYFETCPFHHSQKVVAVTDRYTDFEYFLIPNNELVRELLRYEQSVVVMQPDHLRTKMAFEAKRILNMYRSEPQDNIKKKNN